MGLGEDHRWREIASRDSKMTSIRVADSRRAVLRRVSLITFLLVVLAVGITISLRLFSASGNYALKVEFAGDYKVKVTVSNPTSKPIAVFDLWNSWGWDTLRFEMVCRSGEEIAVSRKYTDWTRNYPGYQLIKPGSEGQLDVDLLDGTWLDSESGRKLEDVVLKCELEKIRAFYVPTIDSFPDGTPVLLEELQSNWFGVGKESLRTLEGERPGT